MYFQSDVIFRQEKASLKPHGMLAGLHHKVNEYILHRKQRNKYSVYANILFDSCLKNSGHFVLFCQNVSNHKYKFMKMLIQKI